MPKSNSLCWMLLAEQVLLGEMMSFVFLEFRWISWKGGFKLETMR